MCNNQIEMRNSCT